MTASPPRFQRRLTAREVVMLAVAFCAATGFVLLRAVVLRSYREWCDLQVELHARSAEYARLARNLAYRQSADEEFERLPPEAFQRNPEQITLAARLRELEVTARRTNLVLVNTKPMPVRHEAGYGVYTVKLSISGRLAEVLQFVSDAVNGPTVAGLGSFSIRAVQGGNSVECSFDLCMVKLATPRQSPPRGGSTDASDGPFTGKAAHAG